MFSSTFVPALGTRVGLVLLEGHQSHAALHELIERVMNLGNNSITGGANHMLPYTNCQRTSTDDVPMPTSIFIASIDSNASL